MFEFLLFHVVFLTFAGSSLALGVDLRICEVCYVCRGRDSSFHIVFLTFSGSSPALGVDLKSAGSNICLPGSSLIVFIIFSDIFRVEYMSAGVESPHFTVSF